MKRRGFFGALGALIAGAAVAKPVAELPSAGNVGVDLARPGGDMSAIAWQREMECGVAVFDEPITSMTTFNGKIFVDSGSKIHVIE